MKHSFLISFLILILSSGFAQQKGLKRSISDFSIIKTEEVFIESEIGNSPPHLLYFDQCIYNQENEFLPVYHELLPLAGMSSVKQIVATKLQKLDPALSKLLKIDEIIPEDIRSSISYKTLRKERFAEIEVLPFIKDSLTGSINRIIEFEIILANDNKPTDVQLKSSIQSITESSVLSSGKWAKMKITTSGIYRISYDEMQSIGFDPANPRIFGNGGKSIPAMNSMQKNLDLVENAVRIEKGSDGVFNSGDYLLFYA